MNTKVASILGCCAIIVALIMAFGATSHSDESGRYQLVFPNGNDCYVFDTKTGRLWFWEQKSRINGVANWEEFLPTISKEKEKEKNR